MKATKIQSMIDESLTTKQGSYKKCYYEVIQFLAKNEKAYPKTWRRHGSSLRDMSRYYYDALKVLGIDYYDGNDAPRGGMEGYFIALTPKGKRQIREWQKSELCRETLSKLQ